MSNRDLSNAVFEKDLPRVKELIRDGVSMDCTDTSIRHPLFCALIDSDPIRIKICKRLIKAGINVNALDNDETLLLLLSSDECGDLPSKYRVRLVKLLLAYSAALDIQDRHGYTALMNAINSRQYKIACLLINAGANVNLKTINCLDSALDCALHNMLHYNKPADIAILQLLLAKNVHIPRKLKNSPLIEFARLKGELVQLKATIRACNVCRQHR